MKRFFSYFSFLLAFVFCTNLLAIPDSNTQRSDVPEIFKWDTNHLYETQEKWDIEYSAASKDIDIFVNDCQGKLSESPATFEGCYNKLRKLRQKIDTLMAYAYLNYLVETDNQELMGYVGMYGALAAKYGESLAFITPEIKEIGEDKTLKWVNESSLAEIKYSFTELFRLKKHILSKPEEEIKAMMSRVYSIPGTMVEAILTTDMNWNEAVVDSVKVNGTSEMQAVKKSINVTEWGKVRTSTDRWARENAARAFLTSIEDYGNIITEAYKLAMYTEQAKAKSSHYSSVQAMKLKAQNIPPIVMDNLINIISDENNLKKTLHKYISVKKKVLKLDSCRFWDNYASMIPSYDAEVTYEESRELIAEALTPYLGKEYVKNLLMASDTKNGWVDVYPNMAKRSGAFNAGVFSAHPFIMLNHNDDFRSFFIAAHEFGHTMHSFYTGLNQPFEFYDMVPYTAEVASTMNETIIYEYLMEKAKKEKNKEFLLYLYDSLLDNMRQTMQRQTQFATFEQITHGEVWKDDLGEPITFKFLSKEYAKLIRKYYGNDFDLTETGEYWDGKAATDPKYLDGYEWGFVSHFFSQPFYVFAYSTAQATGIAMAKAIKTGKLKPQDYIEKLLSTGSAYPPNDIINSVLKTSTGLDLANPDPAGNPVQVGMDYFAEIMHKFERLYFHDEWL